MKKLFGLLPFLFPLLLMGAVVPLEPYRHNFFTTNPVPVVEVTAGTNAFVTFSTVGTALRRYKVDVPTSASGTNGVDGINGTNGVNGTNGLPGVNGTNGLPGINGTNGLPGINGTNGVNGTNADMALYALLAGTNLLTGTNTFTARSDFDDGLNIGSANQTYFDSSGLLHSSVEGHFTSTLIVDGEATFNGGIVGSITTATNDSLGRAISTTYAPLAGTNIFTATNTFQKDLISSANVIATNGLYHFIAQTNATLGFTNVLQPKHAFGFMSMYTTNVVSGGAGVYAVVTNFTTARSNLMGCSLKGGVITNTIAGFYKVDINLSGVAVDNSATVEGDLLLNGVERDDVSFITVFDNPARVRTMSATGILYMTNNTPITFQVKSSGAGGITLWRAQVVISSP